MLDTSLDPSAASGGERQGSLLLNGSATVFLEIYPETSPRISDGNGEVIRAFLDGPDIIGLDVRQ